jgi:hypothetical protein
VVGTQWDTKCRGPHGRQKFHRTRRWRVLVLRRTVERSDSLDTAKPGLLDSPQVAIHDLEAMEAWSSAVPGASTTGRKLGRAKTAGSAHGPWRLANSLALAVALPNACFESLGLPSLLDGPA